MILRVDVMQRGLAAAGHSPGTIDRRYGPDTWNALARWINSLNENDPIVQTLAREYAGEPSFNVRDLGAQGVLTVDIERTMGERLTALAEGRTTSAPALLPFGTPNARPEVSNPLPFGLTSLAAPDFTEFESMIAQLAAGGAGPAVGSGKVPSALASMFSSTPQKRVRATASGGVWPWLVGGTVVAAIGGGLWWFLVKRK